MENPNEFTGEIHRRVTLATRYPSYIVKPRHGMCYFQMQIPAAFRTTNKRKLFRRSLRTSNRKQALWLARQWWAVMEKYNFEREAEAAIPGGNQYDGKIGNLAKISEADCKHIDDLMTRYSSYEHSQPLEAPVPLSEPDELETDFPALRDRQAEFKKRPLVPVLQEVQ